MALFQSAVLQKYLKQQDDKAIAAAYAKFTAHFHDAGIQANIREAKEEQYQEGFLRDLFVNVLGYTLNPQKGYELTSEFKNEKGSKKADGAVLENGKALAVIELKGTDTTDLATINSQAFNYKANHTHCVYVVTSNFQKLRFFVDNAVDWLEFDLFTLNGSDFAVLWLCLQRDNLLGGLPKKVKAESLQEEEQVTKRLYKDYSTFKNALWQDLCTNHPEHDQLLLYKKTQKLLDRFLFVLFSEDKGLLPPNSIREIADQWEKLKELDAYVPLYDRFKKYFGYLNTGHKGQHHDIFAYNGGLFKPDELLDNVRITDEVLHPHVLTLSKYDFGTEVDVNILGHIFEHSLNEIENVTAQLEGRAVDAKKSKRKKDGVFYTPKYITKYIVENTVGRLCTEKKDELAIVDEEYAKGRRGRQKKTIQALLTKLDVYRDWLLGLTICDPACGSGAFLNQALDFLISEHSYVNELESAVRGESIVFKDIGDHILERNIFGVDINEESVEIARLSLWLRTATKGRKLNDLSSNIKCGNSLIDDPAVAGDKAFDWKKEFPAVFAKGGFDVVIGNPPYVGLESLPDDEKEFYRSSHPQLERKYDLSVVFQLRGIELLKPKGMISYVTTITWQTGENYVGVRKHLFENANLLQVVNLPFNVFVDAFVDTGIFVIEKDKFNGRYQIHSYPKQFPLTELIGIPFTLVNERLLDRKNWKIVLTPVAQNILVRAGKDPRSRLLGDFTISTQGLTTSRFVIADKPETPLHFPYLLEGQAYNYHLVEEKVGYADMADKRSLLPFYGEGPKLLIRRLVSRQDRLGISYSAKQMVFKKDVNPFVVTDAKIDTHYLLGVMASRLLSYLYLNTSSIATKDDFRQTTLAELRALPIVIARDQAALTESAIRRLDLTGQIYSLRRMFTSLLRSKYTLPKLSRKLENWPTLDFKGFLKELKKAKVQLTLTEEAEWLAYFNEQKAKATALHQQIDATDKQIDALVYELYGLTEEEIAVVEGR